MTIVLPVVIVVLPCVVIMLCSMLLTCKRKRDRHQWGMRQPLLAEDNTEHRVNAATREAESGFTVCPGCEFENFKRYTYCSLCGEKLLTASDDGESADTKGGGLLEASVRNSSTVTIAANNPQGRTARQLRVRKRKEWVRKVGVDGNMFWYRSCVEPSASSGAAAAESQQPGYVAVFACAKPSVAEEILSLNGRRSHDSSQYDDVADATTTSGMDRAKTPQSLMTDAAIEKMEVVVASKVDPAAHLHFGSNPIEKYSKLSEIIQLASGDFPTKYVHFVVSTAALIVPAEVAFLKLGVHRVYMLEESIDHMGCIDEKDIHVYIRINFLEESGVDVGGVYREWFMLVNEQLLNPTLGLFQCTNKAEQSYYLNPNSAHSIGDDHLTYYFAAGRLIGRALLEGGVWSFHLALPLIKIILGIPVTFSDLEHFDPELYKNLLWLRENEGVEHLGLDFSVTEKRGDEIITIDLIPNGRNIAVTDANKHEYLERRFHYLLFESVSSQLGMLLKGLYEVIPQELLMIFDAEEFDYLLCGTQEIDVEDWMTHTVSDATHLKWNGVLKWFWEVVAEMPNEYRRRLLMFATGSSRVPLGGFAGLTSYDGRLCPFTLKAVSYYSTQYISSHACFNRLDVPLYRSKEELRTVLMAILDTELYGFTTA